MGKHLQRQESSLESNRPGCMWSLMHILDYHNWRSVKKMHPHRKRAGGRRVSCNESQKAILENRDIGKRQEFAVTEAEPLLVKQHSTETSSAKKRSRKSHIKASAAKEKPKEESHKSWILSFPVQSWLWQTSAIHDVEPSENCLDKIRNTASATPSRFPDSSLLNEKCAACDSTNAVDYLGHKQIRMKQALCPKKCEKAVESSPDQKLLKANQLNRDISNDQYSDHVDILRIFKENKEIFLKILQDPDFNTNQFPGLQKSNTKVRLTKSRSFPVADSSRARIIRPSTLKHKQNEVWSFPKGEKLLSGTQAPKLVTPESKEDYSIKSMPYMDGNNSVDNVMKQETSFSSLGFPKGFSHQGWNQLVISRFKDLKQKLMHALQESKQENIDTSIKALFLEDPSGCDGKEISETMALTMGQDRKKVDGLDDNLGKRRVRRTSSLDESLSRYTQLFESSFSSESKWHRSRSLKLKSEEKVPSTGNAQKSTRRNLSLPDLDTFCSILNGAPRDALRLGMPIKNVVDHNTKEENDSYIDPKSVSFPGNKDKSGRLDAAVETEFQNNIVERSVNSANIADTEDLNEYKVEPEIGESRTHQEQEIGFMMNPDSELTQPSESSILEPCFSDKVTSHAEFSISEGSELNPRSPHVNEPDSSLDQHNRCSIDSLPASIMYDPDINYVRDVLELSGFIGNEYLGTWHSLDQPLDPSLFKELEVHFQHELDFYKDDDVTGNWDHQLLFDLVNETLLDIYERSYTYFPRPLSFSGCIHPMPKGHHLLEDVCTRISSYLSLRPEMDQSLDDVISRNLEKGDRWMNLKWETECVALELEDLIFDELLDEVICS